MNRKKDLITTGYQILIASFLLLLIFHLLPQIHPLPQTDFKISRDQAVRMTAEYLEGDIPEEKLKSHTNFVIQEESIKSKEACDEINQLLGYQLFKYWVIELFSSERKNLDFIFLPFSLLAFF